MKKKDTCGRPHPSGFRVKTARLNARHGFGSLLVQTWRSRSAPTEDVWRMSMIDIGDGQAVGADPPTVRTGELLAVLKRWEEIGTEAMLDLTERAALEQRG